MNGSPSLTGRSPLLRSFSLAVIVAAWLGVAAAPLRADPLNPFDFPSLGNRALLSATYTVNTSANPPTLTGPGTNLTGTVLTGTTPSEVAVFRFDSLALAGTVNVTGSRAVAFLSSGSIYWQANLNANGGAGGSPSGSAGGAGGTAGPGGLSGGAGGQALGGGEWGRGAGGGGSDGTVSSDSRGGGFGGAAAAGAPGSGGGAASGVQPNYLLSGGSGGGGGSGSAIGGGFGGGGGGGVVEIGAIATLSVTGVIDVSGGAGGGVGAAAVAGRGGGGSGGTVLLHGLSVSFSAGSVNASGGRGGLPPNGGGTIGGGGGGGGRVHIQSLFSVNTGTINLQGGLCGDPAAVAGAAGVLTVVHPQLSISSGVLDFGSAPIYTVIRKTIFVQNTGDAGSVIYGNFPAMASPFFPGDGTPFNVVNGLKPGMAIAIECVFMPGSAGYDELVRQLTTNGGSSTIRFSGTGVLPSAPACNPADIATAGSSDPFSGPDGFITGEDFDAFVILYFKGC